MSGVRPTKRCLDDLGLPLPPLRVALHAVEHDLIVKAQRLPSEHAAGGADRVLSLSDRMWFKVKVGEHRGAAGHIEDMPDGVPATWWLAAAGIRRGDSKNRDFYARLTLECEQAAKGTRASVSTAHLLPAEIDVRRYVNEQTALGIDALRAAVRQAICQSAHTGQPVPATSELQRLIAWVKTADAETYLAIAAEGFIDPKLIAVVLDAVPGMTAEDWQVEPGEVLGITPSVGQLVFSAMLPPESLAKMLDEHG